MLTASLEIALTILFFDHGKNLQQLADGQLYESPLEWHKPR